MADYRKIEGRRVLVTGAGTGIGRGIALEFAREGADVALHYWPEPQGAETTVQEITGKGGKANAFRADFRQVDQVKRLAKDAIAFLGGIDVLVNNAGITMNLPFEHVTPEQFDTLYHVNVRAQFFLTQAVLPAMGGGGAIINMASNHAFAGMTEHTVYAGTKGAIVASTRVLALELIQKGIRVNAIAPGWVLVESHRETLGDQYDFEAAGKKMPAGFIGTPADIARLALFLASDESRYIVGQTIVCDGGATAVMPLTGDFREPRKEQWGMGYVDGLKKR